MSPFFMYQYIYYKNNIMIKKNLFEVSEEEKRRILKLHETATRKQYLVREQETTGGTPTNKTSTPNTPGVENTPITNDKKYTYYGVIPTAGEQVPKNAVEVAKNSEVAYAAVDKELGTIYRAIPTETNDQGVPTKFDVDTQYTLPVYSETGNETTLKIGIISTDGESYDINIDADPESGKAFVKERTANEVYILTNKSMKEGGAQISDAVGYMFLVNYNGRPRMLVVKSGIREVGKKDIKDVETGELNKEYILTVNQDSVIWKVGRGGTQAWFRAATPFGGYAVISKPETPVKNEDEVVSIKFDAPGDDLFKFDSVVLEPTANQYIDKLVSEIKAVRTKYGQDIWNEFLNFLNSQNLQVLGYASRDGDPTVSVDAKNGCPKSSRQNYDLCLSQRRADAVANAIKEKFKLNITGKGMGYGNFAPNWEPTKKTTTDQTAPNRKFELKIPSFNTKIKK